MVGDLKNGAHQLARNDVQIRDGASDRPPYWSLVADFTSKEQLTDRGAEGRLRDGIHDSAVSLKGALSIGGQASSVQPSDHGLYVCDVLFVP